MISEPENENNHRANIFGTFHDFNQIGIGIYLKETDGKKELFIVQKFIEQ
ncbi:MAG: hypothetical protein U9Q15_02265 [Patescibacteria group bacterium]|nr:hypothetical protein [Patescibacteria group bacterium]